ncbi:MAG: penicillin-insensitive murein endopeptidase [Deltaproteobacteria bacterium]|nr:penicillin-insensitive murein endopeptidase [Deltaproteobacteria bacterium]
MAKRVEQSGGLRGLWEGARWAAQAMLLACLLLWNAPRAQAAEQRRWDLFGLDTAPRAAQQEMVKRGRERLFPYLPDEPQGRSLSVGTAQDGFIVSARPLPLPGDHYAVLPRQLSRKLLYGTQELIASIVSASDAVAAASPGAVLGVGNIGRRDGGDIPYSVSHNAGRDADLAFYATDPRGRPVLLPDLVRFDGSGRSRDFDGFYRFDVARNWLLVRALATDPQVQMEYLFISDPLRALLLGHARQLGEPPEVVQRAASMLMQPGPEIPHDDHLHIRIYCGRADRGAGCENRSRILPGVETFEGIREGRLTQAALFARGKAPEVRVAGLERIAWLGGEEQAPAVLAALSDPVARVREAAVFAAAELAPPRVAPLLADRMESESDPRVQRAILLALGQVGGPSAEAILSSALSRPAVVRLSGKEADLRLVALEGVSRAHALSALPKVAELLEGDDLPVALAAESTLRLVLLWQPEGSPGEGIVERSARAGAWRARIAQVARLDWLSVRKGGLAARGAEPSGSAHGYATSLAPLAGDRDPAVRRAAQEELGRVTGNAAESWRWGREQAARYWVKWVRRHPDAARWRSADR